MKYHFIGIGGISMSGLAGLMFDMGFQITGCDLKKFKTPSNSAGKQNSKLKVFEGHSTDHITKDLDGVIVTAAALHENSPAKTEIAKSKELKIPIIKRSEMIGRLMNDKIGIAVAGMHGKTTVSTMIALILEHAGLDPTALIGSDVKEWGKNYRFGEGKYFVTEACEYARQMLDFRPKIEVITNIEAEHLDTYPGGIKDIKQAFKKFIKLLPKKGMLIVWREDKNLMALASIAKKKKLKVKDVSLKKPWSGLKLIIPGAHNLLDATIAARVCHEIGVSKKVIIETLNNYSGAARRFEIKGVKNGVTVIDDYGHHPTEIRATVEAAREYMDKLKTKDLRPKTELSNTSSVLRHKLIVVFQPHQYSRTKLLFNDFVNAFKGVDKLIITDIYLIAGREPHDARADFSKELVSSIKNKGVDATYVTGYKEALEEITKTAEKGDFIVTLGATDIYKVGEEYLKSK